MSFMLRMRKASLWLIAFAIAHVSVLNIALQPDLSHLSPHPSLPSSKLSTKIINPNQIIDYACNNGSIPLLNISTTAPEEGSTARSILPPHLYPVAYQSCYFLPTTQREYSQHTHLLQYYPNSFLVVTSTNQEEVARIDLKTRTVSIRGGDVYKLLWIKTMILWDYISTQSNDEAFKKCKWFFKVDTDSFLNLHVIEQYLNQYSYNEDHYVGWYAGNGGRRRNNQTINMAIGSFYGFSRSLVLKWHSWQHDKKFTWGHKDDHSGEDSQVSYFLREHGICLDVPVIDTHAFRSRGGIWDGFLHAHPLGPDYFKDDCTKVIQKMLENECFTYAHKVLPEWMSVLADVMKIHVANQMNCKLFGKGISRIANGTVYHRAENKAQCMTDCDPCLKNCCEWESAAK
eukprot:scaffold248391_cov70-Cyclotella_meneghiniana.AAC.17